MLVLKAHAARDGWARIKAIEVLDRSHNGVGGIMGVNLNTHGQARTELRTLLEEKLKCDTLGSHSLLGRGDGASARRRSRDAIACVG